MRRTRRTPPFRTATGGVVPESVPEIGYRRVYWDQRGAGKSFDCALPRSSMTVEQFIADLDDLVDIVCTRVGQEQVVLHGHSWGSALGILYASRYPHKVAAYIGTGQIGDCPPRTSVAYFDLLTTPSKELLWFEESGHEPFVDEPVKFNRAAIDMVRPLVAQ